MILRFGVCFQIIHYLDYDQIYGHWTIGWAFIHNTTKKKDIKSFKSSGLQGPCFHFEKGTNKTMVLMIAQLCYGWRNKKPNWPFVETNNYRRICCHCKVCACIILLQLLYLFKWLPYYILSLVAIWLYDYMAICP